MSKTNCRPYSPVFTVPKKPDEGYSELICFAQSRSFASTRNSSFLPFVLNFTVLGRASSLSPSGRAQTEPNVSSNIAFAALRFERQAGPIGCASSRQAASERQKRHGREEFIATLPYAKYFRPCGVESQACVD